jgi:hypothetical protein
LAGALVSYERVISMAFKALTKVKHNGHWYEPGDTLKKINKEEAERLVELGAAKEEKKQEEEK